MTGRDARQDLVGSAFRRQRFQTAALSDGSAFRRQRFQTAMWRAKPGVCQVAPVPVIAKAA